ncbi:hypothetical protein RDI58_019496 [Solanum bulbocastanum]|uniref:Protein kinase domain-containing protein n=1 Tax=Solanum bulbocastanum TaxID=147425 RepID=A0AAN8T4T5_SOLBU
MGLKKGFFSAAEPEGKRVFASTFVGRRCIIKERFSKKYRHPTLDSKLILKGLNAVACDAKRNEIMAQEARFVAKARRLGVATPVLYAVDPVMHTLTYEYIEGPSVKDIFLGFGLVGVDEERMVDIATQIGNAIGKLHDGGLVHGDLTTSNMLLSSAANHLVLIDFGLSFTSTLPEDKAVDLYVLERALLSMHSSCGHVQSHRTLTNSEEQIHLLWFYMMDRILAAYRKSSKQWSSTLNRLAQGATDSFEAKRKKTHNAWLSFPNSALHVKNFKSSNSLVFLPTAKQKRKNQIPWGKEKPKNLLIAKMSFKSFPL